MKALREAMLARVEKWAAQDGVRILERVAREIFPRIAEDMIGKEIEKLKAETEEKMLARVEKWAAQEGVRVLEWVAREVFPRVAEDMIGKEIEKLKTEAEEKG